MFNQGRRSHLQGEVAWRREAEVRPIRPLKRQPLPEGMPERMRRHDDPLPPRRLSPADIRQLLDERVHASVHPVDLSTLGVLCVLAVRIFRSAPRLSGEKDHVVVEGPGPGKSVGQGSKRPDEPAD